MKILIVNAVNALLSTGEFAFEISEFINKKQNDECYIAYSVGPYSERAFKITNKYECLFHGLMSRAFGMQGYFSPFATNRLISWIKKEKPDVVHLNNLHANYLNVKQLLLFLGKNDIPTVVTMHDCWDYTGKCTHYSSIGCNKWQTGCNSCPKLKSDHKSWFLDMTKLMWEDKNQAFNSIERLAVIGVSDWITDEVRKSPMFKNAKIIKRIYNWVDYDKYSSKNKSDIDVRKKYNIGNRKIILGVASNWTNNKGLDKFEKLSREIGDEYVVVLVGNGELIKVNDKLINIPRIDSTPELVSIYCESEVLMQLSMQETFGKVVAEAMSCGLPIITNNSTANPELVDSNCGIVLNELKTDKMIEAISQIGQHREDYSKNCRETVKQRFCKEELIGEYYNTFKEITFEKQGI